jgi:hypothetical protein
MNRTIITHYITLVFFFWLFYTKIFTYSFSFCIQTVHHLRKTIYFNSHNNEVLTTGPILSERVVVSRLESNRIQSRMVPFFFLLHHYTLPPLQLQKLSVETVLKLTDVWTLLVPNPSPTKKIADDY